jgi:hypothetical protein
MTIFIDFAMLVPWMILWLPNQGAASATVI